MDKGLHGRSGTPETQTTRETESMGKGSIDTPIEE